MSRVRPGPALQRAHSRLLWLIGACIVALICTVHGITDPDFWWHLAIGRLIGQSGIPTTEPFAFAHSQFSWVGQQWLFEVMLAHLTAWGGAVADMVVMGLVGAAAFFVAGMSGTRRSQVVGPALAISVVINGFVAAQVMGVRGQIISVLGVAIVVFILSRWREADQHTVGRLRGDRIVWLLPPLFLLWANFHAGFIAGLAIIAVMCVLPRRPSWGISGHRTPLIGALAVSLIATLITPAGIHLYPYISQTFFNPTLTQLITEWQSPNFHNTLLRLLELEIVALVALWCLDDGPPQWADVVLAGGAVIATLDAQRNVALFAVIATPQLARYGQAVWQRHHHRLRIRPRALYAPTKAAAIVTAIGLLLCCSAGVGVGLRPLFVTAHTDPAAGFGWPEYAADYVAAHFPGQRIFSTYEDGGYLAYRFPKGRVVYIYGESAVFGDATLQQYANIAFLAPNWLSLFDSLDARHAILPEDEPDVAALRELGWTLNCYDSSAQSVVMSAGGPPLTATSPSGIDLSTLPAC